MINLKQINSDQRYEISYGIYETPLGKCLLGRIEDGICHLTFLDNNESLAIAKFKGNWAKSNHIHQNSETDATILQEYFQKGLIGPLNLFIKCTDFQFSVFKALMQIERGTKATYEDIANIINKPKAVRAVANAIGANRIALLVPCHRIISKSGNISKYQWGSDRKMILLNMEQHY